MSVYTSVSDEEMLQFLAQYPLGTFQSLQGIAQGITNSNYFLYTSTGSYVLTLFEALDETELPVYLDLTLHLSENGVACPKPIALLNGKLAANLVGKPACIVSKLTGSDTSFPTIEQCKNVGKMLAKMHLAGTSFKQKMNNHRSAAWWIDSAEKLLPLLDEQDAILLKDEIAYLNKHPDNNLPSGIIHADLFKDNVLLDGEQVAGFIDFYYACNGSFVYDIAIAINDWARHADNTIDPLLKESFLDGYQSVRQLTLDEKNYLPIAYRAGCIRFWVSRLLDFHFPAEGEMTFIKDPNVFRDLLILYRHHNTQ